MVLNKTDDYYINNFSHIVEYPNTTNDSHMNYNM